MNIHSLQTLSPRTGTKVVPAPADYDDASDPWVEAEFRADLGDSASLAGFWEGEPGWVRIDDWPYHEVCVILSGQVAVEDAEGNRRTFSDGDAFVVPRGFRGVWHTLAPTRKVFVGIEPLNPEGEGA